MFPNLAYATSDGGGQHQTLSSPTNPTESKFYNNFMECLLRFTRFWGLFTAIVLCGVGVDFAVHRYTTGYYLIASSALVLWLEIAWVITLFIQICARTENNRMWRCWQGVMWLSGWKKTLVYGPLGAIPLFWHHKLWLAYVSGGQLISLAIFHFLLAFKGRKRRKRKDRLMNGDVESFESSRFEEITDVLDDCLPEPMPGSSHSLSDSLVEPDMILEI